MQKFGKQQRLYKKKEIARLFKNGSVLEDKTFIVIWLKIKESTSITSPIKVLISVPKKNIKKAVDRNKIKRFFREIYIDKNKKLQKEILNRNQQLYLGFIYKQKEITEFSILEQKIKLLLHRLIKKI